MIKTIVEQEPQSTVFLLYGNRSEETILFREQLAQLSQRYKGQLLVEHTLSNPRREKAKGLAGLFSKGTLSWEGRTGRIDDKMVNTFLSENPARSREIVYFICGPGNMIEAVEKSLQKQGIDKKVIHTEHFTSNLSADAPRIQGKDGAHVSVTLNNQTIDIHVPAGKTILHALIDNKYDPPYSCTSGACSTCMAKVQEGSVKMDACYALDDDEVAQGYILTCQSHPTSAEVKISYDV